MELKPENKPEWLRDLQVMRLKPDDIVVLKFKDRLQAHQLNFMQKQWKVIQSDIGMNNKLIILENGTEIGVLSPEK